MAKDSPIQPHATGDGDNSNAALPVRNRDILRSLCCILKSRSKGLKNKSSNQSLNTQDAAQATDPSFIASQPTSIPTRKNHSSSLSTPAGNTATPPSTGQKSIPGIFSEDLPKPTIKTDLPDALDLIEMTQQLVYAQRLIRDGRLVIPPEAADISETPTTESIDESQGNTITESNASSAQGKQEWMPNETERIWIRAQDHIQQHCFCELVKNVVAEFIKDDLKGSAAIAEVVILGPILDRVTYRTLLDCLIAKLKQDICFNSLLPQGLVQLIEDASPDYLEHGDLVDTLTVLQARLKRMYKSTPEQKELAKDKPPSTDMSASDHTLSLNHKTSLEQLCQIIIAISRLLDVMVINEVKNFDRIGMHHLAASLSELEDITEPFVQLQIQYAIQASQYIADDESILQEILRFGGSESMLTLGATGICKQDPETLFSSLGNLREAAGEAYAVVKQLPEGLEAFQQGHSGSAHNHLHGIRAGSKHEWYLTLLFARTYVRHGQLAKFNRTVCGAHCGDNQTFQLGVCQILGEVALDPLWNTAIRQQAVDFLIALSGPTAGWKRHLAVQEWVLATLTQLIELSDAEVKDYAQRILQDLAQEGASATPTIATTTTSFAMSSRFPLPESSPLLVRAQNISYLEYDLHEYRILRIKESHQGIYIPPMAKAYLKARDDSLFSLMDRVEEFLTSNHEVMLILGDSGAGKSTFNRHLEHKLWTNYSIGGPIPLYINLPVIQNPEDDMISKQLQKHNFSEEHIQEMKQHREFILICDGYDESQLTANLHKTNRLNQHDQWRAKMIISCRTQFLGPVYLDQFAPRGDHYQRSALGVFQEAVIMPFSNTQVEDYVTRYVPLEPRSWVIKDYMRMLTTIPNLMDLVRNPFLLTLALETLPDITKGKKNLSTIKIARVQLYDAFVARWLSVNKRRLESNVLSNHERDIFDQLLDAGFVSMGVDYNTRLASAVFDKHGGKPVVQYDQPEDQFTWKAEFFGSQPEIRLLRESSPLTRTDNMFRFIHQSMLEYFFSCYIYSPVRIGEEFDVLAETESDAYQPLDSDGPFFQRNLLKDPSIIPFLCDRVKLHPTFEHQLRAVIDQSKTDTSSAIAATNAVTILNRASVSFNGADFRGVRIPDADLSNGQFDSVQFQGADLAGANFARSWLRQADFSSANLEDVTFGELPHLDSESPVKACCFSPNGRMLAVTVEKGVIYVYDTLTWTRMHRLDGHVKPVESDEYVKPVESIVFSPDSRSLVSSGYDNTLRLWDPITGEELLTLEGHSHNIHSVAISPCGSRIASAGNDGTVRLWDAQTGECLCVLEGHGSYVKSVKYSPDGRQVVSGGWDGTIRLWDSKTGEPVNVSNPCSGHVMSLAYSPDGQWIAAGHSRGHIAAGHGRGPPAAGHDRGHLQLWDAGTLEPGPILSGHTKEITGIDFSPNGQWIASSSGDHTVRLWDVSTGILVSIMTGHTEYANDVSFSPDSLRIASAGDDKKVRLWEASSNWSSAEQHDQTGAVSDVMYSVDAHLNTKKLVDDKVRSLAYSSRGLQLAISTEKYSIHLWDLRSEKPSIELEGHVDRIRSVSYSSCDQWIASGGDDRTVRLWSRQQDTVDESRSYTATVQGFFGEIQKITWSPFVPLEFATACEDGSVRVWRISSGDGSVTVNMLWGSNLRMLCATNMIIRDGTGLSADQKHLLLQHGAKVGSLSTEGERLSVEE
ncbi:hypothetical protein BGZ95_002140 [Linnemannia exigua]|uniref:WD40 repeat-like protein n=1 Tax=Linnemannia exigua TaxID=604196 RepID=A0AAD4H3K4_9FUNG|nr:hypothetical protein BGZ95_002140 [Linnemannia exigua]